MKTHFKVGDLVGFTYGTRLCMNSWGVIVEIRPLLAEKDLGLGMATRTERLFKKLNISVYWGDEERILEHQESDLVHLS